MFQLERCHAKAKYRGQDPYYFSPRVPFLAPPIFKLTCTLFCFAKFCWNVVCCTIGINKVPENLNDLMRIRLARFRGKDKNYIAMCCNTVLEHLEMEKSILFPKDTE